MGTFGALVGASVAGLAFKLSGQNYIVTFALATAPAIAALLLTISVRGSQKGGLQQLSCGLCSSCTHHPLNTADAYIYARSPCSCLESSICLICFLLRNCQELSGWQCSQYAAAVFALALTHGCSATATVDFASAPHSVRQIGKPFWQAFGERAKASAEAKAVAKSVCYQSNSIVQTMNTLQSNHIVELSCNQERKVGSESHGDIASYAFSQPWIKGKNIYDFDYELWIFAAEALSARSQAEKDADVKLTLQQKAKALVGPSY